MDEELLAVFDEAAAIYDNTEGDLFARWDAMRAAIVQAIDDHPVIADELLLYLHDLDRVPREINTRVIRRDGSG